MRSNDLLFTCIGPQGAHMVSIQSCPFTRADVRGAVIPDTVSRGEITIQGQGGERTRSCPAG